MSDSTQAKAGPNINDTMHEVQGVFPSDAALQDAIARLTQSGFDRADLSLPTAQPTVSETTPEQGAADPNTDTDNRQMRTLHASMAGSVGAIAAAGVVIATGGLALPAVAAAAVGGLGAGALAHTASGAADHMQHSERQDAAAKGQLVLSVRAPTDAKRADAEALMRASGATVTQPVRRTDSIVTAT